MNTEQSTGNPALTIDTSLLATSAKQDTGNTSVASIDTKTPALGQALAAASVPVVLTAAQISTLTPVTGLTDTQLRATAVPVSLATAPALVASSAVIGKVGIDQTTPGTTNLVALAANQSVNVAQMNGVTTTMGNGVAGTGVQRVAIASDNTAFSVNAVQSGTWTVQPGNTANTTAWLVKELTSSSSSVTSVASSATSVSLLASTAGRLYASFFNDSTTVLYLKFGATASTSSYTVQLAAGGYFEMSAARIYTGAIDGIWASANGNVRITELT